jgi:hypothetical protein
LCISFGSLRRERGLAVGFGDSSISSMRKASHYIDVKVLG